MKVPDGDGGKSNSTSPVFSTISPSLGNIEAALVGQGTAVGILYTGYS